MIAVVWQFDVRPGREKEFEEFYGVDGEWTAMNRHSRSYLGTSFLRDQNRSTRYVLIEYWSEMLVYEEHKNYRRDQLESLEKRQQALVVSVEPLGLFTALDVPERTGPTWSSR
jgi:quinol monooxygenase YgiN